MDATHKIAQYLGEAKASEDALVRVLQSQISMTPEGSYREALQTHLEETRDHSRRLSARLAELPGGRDLVRMLVDLGEEATAGLARSIRRDEERMLARIGEEIPALTDAVARAQLAGDPSYDPSRTGAAQAVR